MIAVARYINGITLNPLEYLLESNGDVMLFNDATEACEFLYFQSGEQLTPSEWEEEYGYHFIDMDGSVPQEIKTLLFN